MHTLRHLAHQCRQIGPLWLVSAFSFEFANHLLIRTIKGSVKKPNKIVEKSLHRQNDSQEAKEINCSLYVRLSVENQEYASKKNLFQIKSRLTCGGLFYTSSSFTYNKKNTSNSVAFTGNKFVKIEFSAKLRNSELEYAVVRCMKSKKLVDSKHETEAVLFLYKIGKPGELEMIRAEELTWKCVLYELSESTFIVSVMKEGFGHI